MHRICWPAIIALLLLWEGQQVSVVAVAQEQRSKWAAGDTGPTATTESGVADGERSPALTGERRPLYRLRNSDVMDVDFRFASEFNQSVTVQPDGFITLKGVEKQMYAQGMTVPELRESIHGAYAAMLHNPEVTVVLKEFDRPYFIAGGEVARPGKYDLRSETTVVEAVAIAGGFTGQARHSQVVLFRHVSGAVVEARLLDIKRMLNSHDLREDVHLHPGDMLFVPQSTISKIRLPPTWECTGPEDSSNYIRRAPTGVATGVDGGGRHECSGRLLYARRNQTRSPIGKRTLPHAARSGGCFLPPAAAMALFLRRDIRKRCGLWPVRADLPRGNENPGASWPDHSFHQPHAPPNSTIW